MWPETFSQYDEQQAILQHCRITGEPQRFLDIGAWDPKCFSNTRALFERGWGGVMIEPSPGPMLNLLKEYGHEPRISLVQAAVGLEDSILPFQMTNDCVSSSDAEHNAKCSEAGNPNQAEFLGRCFVRTITWDQICLWYGGFQFVNIDAEGLSVDLFHSMLRAGVKPRLVCVEHDGRLMELAAAATAVSYRLVYSNGTNGVFVL